eukprot:Phypoly_transcript_16480.p1 GENE.Phypoly_transcript_16480~~Phypoly_transcript_16480.p1  ORF type:complete len:140 (+),score=29.08 Phypoly_transcript_16480:33-452(+)
MHFLAGRLAIFLPEFWGKDTEKREPTSTSPAVPHKVFESDDDNKVVRSGSKERMRDPKEYSLQDLGRAIIVLKDQLEYEIAAREQAEKERRFLEERMERMETYMKAMEENIRSTVRNFVEEELYAREHDPNKNWPISYS